MHKSLSSSKEKQAKGLPVVRLCSNAVEIFTAELHFRLTNSLGGWHLGVDLRRTVTSTPAECAGRASFQAIDVDKSSSHQLSQTEIGGDNPCSQHLSERLRRR